MNDKPSMRLVSGLMVVLAAIILASSVGIGDSNNEYWGGEKGIGDNQFYQNEKIYPMGPPSYRKLLPKLTDYQGWKWDPPICYELANSSVHSWTAREKAVARQAIEEWNQVPSPYRGKILETGTGECKGLPPDISIRWEDHDSFFHNWGDPNEDGLTFNAAKRVGMYVPSRTAPPFRVDPCKDLTAAGSGDGCNLIVLNLDNPSGWFIDKTPRTDEEFVKESKNLCGIQQAVLKAQPGGLACKKQDLMTIIAHEFGHALGLIHSGGCDRKPWTPRHQDLSDDDGSLMWGGPLVKRSGLSPLETLYVGYGERRHVRRVRKLVKAPDLEAEITRAEVEAKKMCPEPERECLERNPETGECVEWGERHCVREDIYYTSVDYNIKNTGGSKAGYTTAEVTIEEARGFEEELERKPVPRLDPGDKYSPITGVEFSTDWEPLEVTVCVDNYDQVKEADEKNNCDTKKL